MEDFLDLDISLPSGGLCDDSIELDLALFDNLPDPNQETSKSPDGQQGENFRPPRTASTPIQGVVRSSKLFNHLKLAATKPTLEENLDASHSSIQEETSEISDSPNDEHLQAEHPQPSPEAEAEGVPGCSWGSATLLAATSTSPEDTATTQPLPAHDEQPPPEEDCAEFDSSLEYAKLMKTFYPPPENERNDSPPLDYALLMNPLSTGDKTNDPNDNLTLATAQDCDDSPQANPQEPSPPQQQSPARECSAPIHAPTQDSATAQYIAQAPPNCLPLQQDQQVLASQPLTTQPQLQYEALQPPSQCTPLENQPCLFGSVPPTAVSQEGFVNAQPMLHCGAPTQPQLQYKAFQPTPPGGAPLETQQLLVGSITAAPQQDAATTEQSLPIKGSAAPHYSLLNEPLHLQQHEQHQPVPVATTAAPQQGFVSEYPPMQSMSQPQPIQCSATQPRMSKQILGANIRRLMQRVELCATLLDGFDKLFSSYEAQVSKIENSRKFQMSRCKGAIEEIYIDVSHTSHHNELIHKFHQALDKLEHHQFSQAASSVETAPIVQVSPPPQPTSSSTASVQQSSPDAPSAAHSPPAATNSFSSTNKAPGNDIRIPTVAELRTYKQKSIIECLNTKATDALNKWYADNYHAPYASDEEVRELAEAGDILPVQVRKWLCNKRRRDNNYLKICEQAELKDRKRKRSEREGHKDNEVRKGM
ncbi:hypothetical protein CAPTEDRAFT_204105 [Capitella teleta]|uniref:Homeobox domain-containing protein n=1 Tax=Capitella teleta TaxID=283909 RepID=R7UN27_CAPTE|nr:hypothetical protein CAPTEDRAFT_204105 [Capitella teleta]|eukprot:ELU07493.1 hypothetical protein CAPTEDRAFT_204105 [Capitella teleta]